MQSQELVAPSTGTDGRLANAFSWVVSGAVFSGICTIQCCLEAGHGSVLGA